MAVTTPATFGDFLRFLRKRAGLTQGDLAAAVGYSVSFISTLEGGQRRPDPDAILRRFVPTLGLESEPALAARLVELAGGALAPSAADRGSGKSGAPTSQPPHSVLPHLPVDLIGRSDDIAWICQRLMAHPGRLLTLTGPPGVGKTSLALAVAHAVQALHCDGAHFVALAAVEQPGEVAPAIAAVLGIPETRRTAEERVAAFLRDKDLLLVLDNFEQVMAASGLVATLLARCPHLRVLVTSRARLRLRAEQLYPAPPLSLAPACTLFVERVRAADPRRTFSAADLADIEEICRRLDGLPLAIELIAAQSEGLAPAALLTQLRDRRFDLLQGSASDPPPDQRALTNALHRSYHALPAEEQALFRAIGVFAGGCDLAAAAQLGFDLPVVQALVHKSLVRMTAAGSERRIVQLETLREYARWQLDAAGETLAVEAQRLAYVVALAERAEPHLHSAAQTEWLHRLEANLPNFHGALDFALAGGQLDAGVRLVAALSHFWVTRNHLAETLRRLHLLRVAATEQGIDDHLWARLLNCQATIAFYLGNFELARESYATALAHAERVGNRRDMAYALDGLGAEAANRDDLTAARAFSARSLTHSLASEDHWLAGIALINLGEIARAENDYATAAQHYAESLTHLEVAGDPFFIAVAQINQAQVCLHDENLPAAEHFLRRSLEAGLNAESAQVVAPALEKLAYVLLKRERGPAAHLMGLAEGLRHSTAISVQPVDQYDREQVMQALRALVETSAYRAAYDLGASQDWLAIRGAILL